jgi:hypothetical protein
MRAASIFDVGNLLMLSTVVILVIASGSASHAKCVMKYERIPDAGPSCTAMVGYADGVRVGPYLISGQIVRARGDCGPASSQSGSIVGSDRVRVGGAVRVLSEDCRSSTPAR